MIRADIPDFEQGLSIRFATTNVASLFSPSKAPSRCRTEYWA